MKYRYISFILTLLCMAILPAALTSFDITEKTGIVLPEKPAKSSVLAAEELARYVKKTSGINIRIGTPEAENRIFIGLVSDFSELPAEMKEKLMSSKADDSYVIHVSGSRMYIIGKSKPADLYAVYQFLDRELGIRFFKPANRNDPGEYVPFQKRDKITIADQIFFREPAYRRRLLYPTGWDWVNEPVNGVIWSVKGGFQMLPTYYHKWRSGRKNAQRTDLYEPRTADIWDENGHSILQSAIPADLFKEHPEYFALVDGKRTCHPNLNQRAYCLSNPEVRRLTAEYIIRNIREKRDLGLTYLSGDGMADMTRGFCECDNCRRENNGSADWNNISAVHSKAFKEIYDRVRREIPDAELLHWAYYTYRQPPEPAILFDERVSLLFMTHGRCYAHTFADPCPRNEQLYAWLQKYLDRFKQVSLYEYFLCSEGQNYVPQELVQAQDLKFFHKLGVTGWQEEVFFEDSVSPEKDSHKQKIMSEKLPSLWQWFYLTGKMLWDLELDPLALLDEAETLYYGKACVPMKKYHALRRKLWADASNHFGYPTRNERIPFLLNNPEDRDSLLDLLDEAEKLAAGDELILYRLSNDRRWLQKYWVEPCEKRRELAGKTLQAPGAPSGIVIDGDGSDLAWRSAFYLTSGLKQTFTGDHKELPEALHTTLGLLSDENSLYLLITAMEPSPEKMKMDGGPDGNVWADDGIELFLHPLTADNQYYHLVINPAGAVFDSLSKNDPKSFTIPVEVKTKILKDRYVIEARLPLEKLKLPERGEIWLVNFARNRRIQDELTPADNTVSTGMFSLDGALYHDVSAFRPMEIGSPYLRNGSFEKLDENGKPEGWTLRGKSEVVTSGTGKAIHLNGNAYQLLVDRDLFQCPSERKVSCSFTASGKGKLHVLFYRYKDVADPGSEHCFRREYLGDDLAGSYELTENPRAFSVEYTIRPGEWVGIAFHAGDAILDNVSLRLRKQ